MIKRLFNLIIPVSLLLFALSGCKTTTKVATVRSDVARAPAEFFGMVQEQSITFNTLTARMQVELSMPNKSELSSRVDMKVVKDSALLLSIQPLFGVELFRVVMNPDSILLIDRINRRYFRENYADLKKQIPFDFNYYNLQALFVNQIFLPGKDGLTAYSYDSFNLAFIDGQYEAKTKDRTGLEYIFRADGEEKLLSTYILDANHRNGLQWAYADFRVTEAQTFPMAMRVVALSGGEAVGGMDMNFSRIQTGQPVDIDFAVPERYNKVSVEQILRSLTGSTE